MAASFPSSLGRDGARIRNPGPDTLGRDVSATADAIPGNADRSDDGVSGLILDLGAIPVQARVVTHVGITPNAPSGPRFLNVLIDLNADGSWERAASGDADEWVVQNHQVTVAPGASERIVLPAFTYGNTAALTSAAWMRVLLTRQVVAVPDWAGAGEFEFGEVEDYLVRFDPIPVPVIECPAQISLGGTFLRPVTCTLTNLGGAGDVDVSFTRMIDDRDDQRTLRLADVQSGEQRDVTLIALRRDPLTPWRYDAAPVVESIGSVENGVIVPLLVMGEGHLVPATEPASFADVLVDEAGDLFHGDPTLAPVRQDTTVDTAFWGVGRLVQTADNAVSVPGPDGGLFVCDGPPGRPGFMLICGSDAPDPGTHLAVWNCTVDPVPLTDPSTVRTYWVMFQDGSPDNDFKALPQFANDVLGDSDVQYWVEWNGAGWSLRRTAGPGLTPSPTAAWVVIADECVTVLIPESEIGLSDATAVGVSGYSGPLADPFGAQATSDRAPGAQQPLLLLADATQWTLPYAVLAQRDPPSRPATTVESDDGQARLTIPDGALPEVVAASDIQITRMALDEIPIGFGDTTPVAAYHLQPDGLQLASPATLEIVIESPGDVIPMVVHLGEQELDFPDVSTEVLDDGRMAVQVPVMAFSRWVVATDGWFSAKADDPDDHMVGDSFEVSASVRKNRGVVRYVIGGYYSDEERVVAGLIGPWKYRGNMMNPSFVDPPWLYPAPALTSVRGNAPPPYTGTVTCVRGGRGGLIYTAGFVFTVEELHLSLDGRFRYKVRVHKVTGVSPFSRMFECNSAPSVSEIKAVFVPSARSTIYWVEASDPDGDDLAFDWTLAPSRRPCGVFTAGHDMLGLDPTVADAIKRFTSTTPTSLHGQGAMAIWHHPQELCPHDATAEHEGTISVVVSDGRTPISKEYDRGSRTNQSR